MVELADTQDLGSCIARCAGSSPVIRTKPEKSEPNFPNRKRVRIFCLYLTLLMIKLRQSQMHIIVFEAAFSLIEMLC